MGEIEKTMAGRVAGLLWPCHSSAPEGARQCTETFARNVQK